MPPRQNPHPVRRRTFIVASIITVATIVAVAIFWGLGNTHTSASATPRTRVALPAIDTTRLDRALSSSDKNTQATALIPSERSAYLSGQTPPFPSGVTVTIDPNSFKRNGDASAVYATDSQKQKWILHLYLATSTVNGKSVSAWYILYVEGV